MPLLLQRRASHLFAVVSSRREALLALATTAVALPPLMDEHELRALDAVLAGDRASQHVPLMLAAIVRLMRVGMRTHTRAYQLTAISTVAAMPLWQLDSGSR